MLRSGLGIWLCSGPSTLWASGAWPEYAECWVFPNCGEHHEDLVGARLGDAAVLVLAELDRGALPPWRRRFSMAASLRLSYSRFHLGVSESDTLVSLAALVATCGAEPGWVPQAMAAPLRAFPVPGILVRLAAMLCAVRVITTLTSRSSKTQTSPRRCVFNYELKSSTFSIIQTSPTRSCRVSPPTLRHLFIE